MQRRCTLLRLLKINERHVYHVKKVFQETGDVCHHSRAGQPCSAHTKNVVNAVRARITQKPCCTQKIISQRMNLPPRTDSHVLREDLGLRAYRRYSGHLLDNCLRCLLLKRFKKLLHVYGKNLFKKIWFLDKNIFTIVQKFNIQNDKVSTQTSYKAKAEVSKIWRSHHSSSVMAWWEVSRNGTTTIHFCIPGVKTNRQNLCRNHPRACSEATRWYFLQGEMPDLPTIFSTSSQVKMLKRMACKQRSCI